MRERSSNSNNSKQQQYDPQIELLHKILDDTAQFLISQFPHVQKIVLNLFDMIFVPKVIMNQLILLVVLETGLVTVQQITYIIQSFSSTFSSRSRLIRTLHNDLLLTKTQDEWMDLAERIDNIQGNDIWRSNPNCPLYERERIAARIDEYIHLMRRRDIFELMFVLRGSIGRNKFGLLHEGLFTRAMAGSKVLTETYHNVVCAALDFVCDAPILPDEEPIPTDARLAFFNETRHAYGRTALLLSGGAALGFYHVGVVKTLIENRLMPRVIGGSSAGSIVCSMIGTRTDEECLRDLFEVRGTNSPGHSGLLAFNFFRPIIKGDEDNNVAKNQLSNGDVASRRRSGIVGGLMEVYYNTAGAFHDAKRTLQGFVPIPMRRITSFWYDLLTGNTRPQDIFNHDTNHFRECVRLNVGNFTFQEAFDRTGRILNIVVTPNNSSDPPRLLNYLTAPHVMVWSAAVASSSLPGVFEANRLVVKEADGYERYESGGGQVFSDGSMEQDLPMQQLSEMFNVNHFIISQANPHAVMFASYNQKVSVWSNPFTGFVHQILVFLKDQVRSWLLHLVSCVGARRITPLFETQRGIGATFFTQEYEGRSSDISLIPWLNHRGLFSAMMHIIYNPSEPEFKEWIQAAERETWKYIPAIKSHIAEEITLDRCVQRLRRRMVQESWEKHTGGNRESIGTFARNAADENNNKMEGRVPSFFTSNSLVNLSGLGVADQPATEDLHEYAHIHQTTVPPVHIPSNMVVASDITMNSGWGGMGLRGNRSTNNLQRTSSDASGLFIDEDEARQQDAGETATQQPAGALVGVEKKNVSSSSLPARTNNSESDFINEKGYVKTTSMAKFYYRRSASKEPLNEYNDITQKNSDSGIESEIGKSDLTLKPSTNHIRRKSKSHLDLSTQEYVPLKE